MPTVQTPLYAKPRVTDAPVSPTASVPAAVPAVEIPPVMAAPVPPVVIPPDVDISLEDNVIQLTAVMRSTADVASVMASLTALGNLMKDS